MLEFERCRPLRSISVPRTLAAAKGRRNVISTAQRIPGRRISVSGVEIRDLGELAHILGVQAGSGTHHMKES